MFDFPVLNLCRSCQRYCRCIYNVTFTWRLAVSNANFVSSDKDTAGTLRAVDVNEKNLYISSVICLIFPSAQSCKNSYFVTALQNFIIYISADGGDGRAFCCITYLLQYWPVTYCTCSFISVKLTIFRG